MLIDIHVHCAYHHGVLRPNGSRYPTPPELIGQMDAAGICKAVVLSGVSPECRYRFVPTEEVLAICTEYPDRLIPFAGLDPRMLTNSDASDFGGLLSVYKEAGCKGVGEYVANIPFDDPLHINLLKQVEAAGLPLTFHLAGALGGCYGCYDDLGLMRLEKVLQACPDLVFLGHSQVFWSEISGDVTEKTRHGYPTGSVVPGRVIELMRTYPNLHGDLSAGSGYNAIRRDPEFGWTFLEEFQDRLYFGTDLANIPQELPIVDYFRELREEARISAEAYEKIAWKNAARLLGLDVRAHA